MLENFTYTPDEKVEKAFSLSELIQKHRTRLEALGLLTLCLSLAACEKGELTSAEVYEDVLTDKSYRVSLKGAPNGREPITFVDGDEVGDPQHGGHWRHGELISLEKTSAHAYLALARGDFPLPGVPGDLVLRWDTGKPEEAKEKRRSSTNTSEQSPSHVLETACENGNYGYATTRVVKGADGMPVLSGMELFTLRHPGQGGNQAYFEDIGYVSSDTKLPTVAELDLLVKKGSLVAVADTFEVKNDPNRFDEEQRAFVNCFTSRKGLDRMSVRGPNGTNIEMGRALITNVNTIGKGEGHQKKIALRYYFSSGQGKRR